MRDSLKLFYEPLFQSIGCDYSCRNEQDGSEWICFSLRDEKGRGQFWGYFYENLFAITIQDMVLYDDLYFEYQAPICFCVNCYDSVSGEELHPYKRLSCNSINIHIGDNSQYKAVFHKNIPIRFNAENRLRGAPGNFVLR